MSIDIDIPEVAKRKYYTSGIKGRMPWSAAYGDYMLWSTLFCCLKLLSTPK